MKKVKKAKWEKSRSIQPPPSQKTLLETDFAKLSTTEKENICRDLYGIQDPIDETKEFVDNALREIEKELNLIPDETKTAYLLAIELENKHKKEYTHSKQFRLMFLRAERFDAKKTASRVVLHFKTKLYLFGPDKLHRPITQADLNEDDLELLYVGCFNSECGVDRAGRRIMMCNRQLLKTAGLMDEKHSMNLQRATYYFMMKIVEKSEDAQKNGIVFLAWMFGLKAWSKEHFLRLSKVVALGSKALGIRFVAVHKCYGCTSEAIVYMVKDGKIAADENSKISTCEVEVAANPHASLAVRTRYRHHQGSPSECLFKLLTYGIAVDRLPLVDGVYAKQYAIEILKQDQLKEEYDSSKSNNGDITSPIGLNEKEYSRAEISDNISTDEPSVEFNIKAGATEMNKTQEIRFKQSIETTKIKGITELKKNDNKYKEQTMSSRLQNVEDLNGTPGCKIGITGVEMDALVEESKPSPPIAVTKEQVKVKQSGKGERSGGKPEKFPLRLMRVLKSNRAKEAMWWMLDGTAIAIQPKRIAKVLSNEFNGIRYNSFLHSLRRWGFKRLPGESAASNILVYMHPEFQKDSPDLLEKFVSQISYESQSNKLKQPAVPISQALPTPPINSLNPTALWQLGSNSVQIPFTNNIPNLQMNLNGWHLMAAQNSLQTTQQQQLVMAQKHLQNPYVVNPSQVGPMLNMPAISNTQVSPLGAQQIHLSTDTSTPCMMAYSHETMMQHNQRKNAH